MTLIKEQNIIKMTITNSIEKDFSISKYRTSLMGLSMIWVMLFHLPISLSFFNPIKSIGYLGVDIFLFLSSYGLYYGFKKDNFCIKKFYKKRVLRILPSYYFVLFLTFLIDSIITSKFEITVLFQKTTFLGFFFPHLHIPVFLWYIPAILILYIIFPYIYKKRNDFKKIQYLLGMILFVFCISFIILTYSNDYNTFNNNFLLIFIPRIIPFVLGTIWADIETYTFYKRIKLLPLLFIGVTCLLIIHFSQNGLPIYYLKLFMLETFPFIFAIPFCFLVFIIVYEYSHTLIQKFINYAGKYSLELYLIHESLYRYTIKIADYYHLNDYYLFPLTTIICFILAYCLNDTIKNILTKAEYSLNV